MVTPQQIVTHPDGRDLALAVRRRGLPPGGGDAGSLALDAVSSLVNRIGKLGWLVEVRPWPTGRKLLSERFDTKTEAIERAETLGDDIAGGPFGAA